MNMPMGQGNAPAPDMAGAGGGMPPPDMGAGQDQGAGASPPGTYVFDIDGQKLAILAEGKLTDKWEAIKAAIMQVFPQATLIEGGQGQGGGGMQPPAEPPKPMGIKSRMGGQNAGVSGGGY